MPDIFNMFASMAILSSQASQLGHCVVNLRCRAYAKDNIWVEVSQVYFDQCSRTKPQRKISSSYLLILIEFCERLPRLNPC